MFDSFILSPVCPIDGSRGWIRMAGCTTWITLKREQHGNVLSRSPLGTTSFLKTDGFKYGYISIAVITVLIFNISTMSACIDSQLREKYLLHVVLVISVNLLY